MEAPNAMPKVAPNVVPKVTIHYANGSTYTHKHCLVENVNWDMMEMYLVSTKTFCVTGATIAEDVLAISYTKNNKLVCLQNPAFKLSVQLSVMTVKQRTHHSAHWGEIYRAITNTIADDIRDNWARASTPEGIIDLDLLGEPSIELTVECIPGDSV